MHTGNTIATFPVAAFRAGLSLCIQGTLVSLNFDLLPARFIPVHTGNTLNGSIPLIFLAVYPCAYREHMNKLQIYMNNYGLSLCIQGTQKYYSTLELHFRFIPVHTGNTKLLTVNTTEKAVYPCAYREHNVTCGVHELCFGLSLCIQGTLIPFTYIFILKRFIPVHTGNTLCRF